MKQDPKLVAALQKYEVYYIAHRYNCPAKIVRELLKGFGRSRKRVYKALTANGYCVVNK